MYHQKRNIDHTQTAKYPCSIKNEMSLTLTELNTQVAAEMK